MRADAIFALCGHGRAHDRRADFLHGALRRYGALAGTVSAGSRGSSSPTIRRVVRAGAGILSAWVGSTLVMLTTAFFRRAARVAAGVYLEEYASKNWVTPTSSRSTSPTWPPACLRSCTAFLVSGFSSTSSTKCASLPPA